MSLLLAVVTATPSITPQVVEKVTTLQPVIQQTWITPQGVVQLLHLIEVTGLGALISFLHFVVERGKLPAYVNRLIVVAYTALTSAAYMIVTGKTAMNADDVQVAGTVVASFLGANQLTHMAIEQVRDIWAKIFAKAPVVLASEAAE